MKASYITQLKEDQLDHIVAAGFGSKLLKVCKKINFIRTLLKAIDDNI